MESSFDNLLIQFDHEAKKFKKILNDIDEKIKKIESIFKENHIKIDWEYEISMPIDDNNRSWFIVLRNDGNNDPRLWVYSKSSGDYAFKQNEGLMKNLGTKIKVQIAHHFIPFLKEINLMIAYETYNYTLEQNNGI
jgi:hypothetical protein